MKSVLVISMGKFGRHFAKKMIDLGKEVMIVDKDESLVELHAATFSDAQYIVSKAESDIQADFLMKIGTDEIVYPEREMAEKIAVPDEFRKRRFFGRIIW